MVVRVRRKFPLVCSVRASIHRLEHRVLSSMPSVWRPSVSCCCWDRIGTQPHAPSATRTVPCVHFFFFFFSAVKPEAPNRPITCQRSVSFTSCFLMRRDMLAFSTYYYYYGREASFFGGRRYFEKKRSQDQK